MHDLQSSHIGIWLRAKADVTIDETRVTGSGGGDGILVLKGDVVINRSHSEDNAANGINVDPDAATSVQVFVRDSVLARNGSSGLVVSAASPATARS